MCDGRHAFKGGTVKKSIVVLAATALVSACGGSDSTESSSTPAAAAAETEALPRRGDVWEIDPQSQTDAQVYAYLYGLHAFVRQGDEVYTATTRLGEVREDGEILVAALGGGLEARIESGAEKPALTFSNGAVAMLREHQEEEGQREAP